MKPVVTLTPSEIFDAAQVGCQRQVQNIKNNSTPAYGSGSRNDWQLHISGALGEKALAKYLGIYWSGKGQMRAPDVGNVDVRTRSEDWHDLIIHPNDPDDRTFYLLTGNNGTYTVHGCIQAKDAKVKDFWKDPAGGRPAYFIPQSALKNPHNG